MNRMALGYQELLIILAIIVVLFGASRLPQLAKALGQSKRAFREGQAEAEEEARLEQGQKQKAGELRPASSQSQLNNIDDEQLFEEARRRASRLHAAENDQGK